MTKSYLCLSDMSLETAEKIIFSNTYGVLIVPLDLD